MLHIYNLPQNHKLISPKKLSRQTETSNRIAIARAMRKVQKWFQLSDSHYELKSWKHTTNTERQQ